MRKFFYVLTLLLQIIVAQAQVVQPGVVMVYDLKQKKSPFSRVKINATGAGTTHSDQNGRFTLVFNNKKPGDKVEASIKRTGYEIFNTQDVNQWFISRNRTPFTILLVNSKAFNNKKHIVKEKVTDNYKTKYKKSVQEIEKLKKENKLKEEEYKNRIAEAERKFNELMSKVDARVDEFVRIDLSEVSQKEQEIQEMVQDGRIEEAIKAYKELRLIDNYKEEAASIKSTYNSLLKQKSALDHLYDATQREVVFYAMTDHEEEAKSKLDSLLDEVKPLAEIFPNEYDEKMAHIYYQIGELAMKAWLHEQYSVAIDNYRAAENIYLKLTKNNPEQYLPFLAETQQSLGVALIKEDSFKEAEEYYLKSLNNWNLILNNSPDNPNNIYHIAYIQHKLGALYLDMYQEEVFSLLFNEEKDTTSNNINRIHNIKSSAESIFSEAFKNYNKIIPYNPCNYRLALAEAQRDLGMFYMMFSEYAKSEKLFNDIIYNMKEAITIKDSVVFVEKLVDAQQTLAQEVYRCLGQNEKREECLLSALDNCYRYLSHSPEEIAWTFQCVFDDLSHFYSNSPEKKESFLKSTLDRINHMCNDNVNDRIHLLRIHVEDELFNYLQQSHKITLAEKLCKEKLNIYKPLFLQNSEKYNDQISYYYRKLRSLYSENEDFIEKLTKTYLDELELWQKKFEQNPDKYCLDLCNQHLYIGEYYKQIKDFDKAEEHYCKGINLINNNKQSLTDKNLIEEKAILQIELGNSNKDFIIKEELFLSALENYSILYQQKPERYVDDWLLMHERLGALYLYKSQFDKSKEHFNISYKKRLEHFKSIPSEYDRIWDLFKFFDKIYRSQKEYTTQEKFLLDFLSECETLFLNSEKNKSMYDILVKAYTLLGTFYSSIDDYDNAIKTYSSVLEKGMLLYNSEPNLYRKSIAKLHETIGFLYRSTFNKNRDYTQAIKHYSEAKELYNAFPSSYQEELARVQESLGLAYWRISNKDKTSSDKAEECLLDASNRYYYLWQQDFGQPDTSPFKYEYMRLQLVLGDFYYDLGETEKAKKHYFRMLEYQKKNGNSKELIEKLREKGILDDSLDNN